MNTLLHILADFAIGWMLLGAIAFWKYRNVIELGPSKIRRFFTCLFLGPVAMHRGEI